LKVKVTGQSLRSRAENIAEVVLDGATSSKSRLVAVGGLEAVTPAVMQYSTVSVLRQPRLAWQSRNPLVTTRRGGLCAIDLKAEGHTDAVQLVRGGGRC